MALTPTTAWYEAVTRADAQIRMLVEIYDGTNTWKATSGSMVSTSDLYSTAIPAAVRSVAPLGIELDPFTRAIEVAVIDIEVDDLWIRPLIVNYRLKGQRVNIKLGAAELDESDFLAYATNSMIEDIEPIDAHTVRLGLIGQFKLVMDAIIPTGYWINTHPLECLYKGDGTGILELAGGHTFDANAFDRTQLQYDSIDHVIAGRAYVNRTERGQVLRYDNSGLANAHQATALSLSQNVMRLINGYLLENEDGKFTVARFDDSTAPVDAWTEDDIIPGSFKQEVLDSNIINEITANFGSDPDGNLRSAYTARDTTSQSTYAFPGGAAARVIADEFDNIWVGTWQRLYNNISDSDVSLELAGPRCYAVSGNRADMTVDSDHPVYLMIDSAMIDGTNNTEIVKCEGLTRSSTFVGEVSVFTGGRSWTTEGPFSAHLTFTSVSRAQYGTSASAHTKLSTVLDITALVLLLDELLARFADGCPIIELETPINKAWVQIGDLVTVDWSKYLAYGDDGITSADKWEVITKEVDAMANPPKMRVRLAHAYTGSPTVAALPFTRPSFADFAETVASNKLVTQFVVVDGLGITQKAGLVGTIAAGQASNGVRSVYLLQDRDHTFTASKDTYVYLSNSSEWFAMPMYKEAANGGADPGTEDNEVYLGTVVTDGAGITAVNGTAETLPIPGSKLKTGTGPLTKLSQGGFLDALTSVTSRALDDITDGASYRRVGGVSASNQCQPASLADLSVSPASMQKVSLGSFLNANARFSARTRG